MRRCGPLAWTLAWLGVALLYVPLLAVAVASVNSARYGAHLEGFSLKWYASLFGATAERQALAKAIRDDSWNTLALACWSTAISTALGTLLALGLERAPWPRRLRALADLLIRLPLVVPDLLLAAALVIALAVLRRCSDAFAPGLPAMVVGHVAFQISFVCLVVHARLRLIGVAQLEAARDLYASGWYVTSRIVLPQLVPAVVAGAMLAFTLSLDDFVVSFFTASPSRATLPMLIWAEVRRGVAPEIHALSTLIVLATAAAAFIVALLTRPRRSQP